MPWQVVFHGRGIVPRPGHSSRNPSTPKKKFPGEVRGYQEPSGASQVKSSHLYLYSAFNNTNCDKATAQYQKVKIVSIM